MLKYFHVPSEFHLHFKHFFFIRPILHIIFFYFIYLYIHTYIFKQNINISNTYDFRLQNNIEFCYIMLSYNILCHSFFLRIQLFLYFEQKIKGFQKYILKCICCYKNNKFFKFNNFYMLVFVCLCGFLPIECYFGYILRNIFSEIMGLS